jgi:hypothetical protein
MDAWLFMPDAGVARYIRVGKSLDSLLFHALHIGTVSHVGDLRWSKRFRFASGFPIRRSTDSPF